MTRILICGSRTWSKPDAIEAVLSLYNPRDTVMIHGACRGADNIADGLARKRGFTIERYPANWRGGGRGAGAARNKEMLREGKPDIVLAFKHQFDHELRRGGTENMVRLARAAGVRTFTIESADEARAVYEILWRERCDRLGM